MSNGSSWDRDSRPDVSDLKREIGSKENKIQSLENELKRLKEHHDAKIKELEGKITKLENEKRLLEEELRKLRSEVEQIMKRKNDRDEDSPSTLKAWCIIATMCDDMENMMFKRVFPEQFNDNLHYKVKDIEEKLNEEGQSSKRRAWNAVKREFNWDKQHLNTVKHLKRKRNEKAHPKENLTKESLMEAIQLLKEIGAFNAGLSVDVTNQLITIWETLTDS